MRFLLRLTDSAMTKRAEASGIRLTDDDAALVKGMLARGDRQHDIAAWFGVNGGRIANVSSGKTHGQVKAATKKLPPKGPYLSSRDAYAALYALKEAQATISAALELISERTGQP
jgi:hypothetical protein